MSNNSKKVIILRHGGGRLGNQLWLYASIYAFCLEKNYKCLNYSFYNYLKYYNIPSPHVITTIFKILANFQLDESHASTYILYLFYKLCTHFLFINQNNLLKHYSDDLFFLPPTSNLNKSSKKKILQFINSNQDIYFDGHNFSNPRGIKKYHAQIKELFNPKKEIKSKIKIFLKPYTNFYKIGVHIRQGDYKRFRNGKYYFTNEEVAKRLKYFLKHIYKGRKQVVFLIFSDCAVDKSSFKSLNCKFASRTTIEDLYTLSECNVIVASKSSFSSFAAYYGGIKLYLFERNTLLKPHNYYLWQL